MTSRLLFVLRLFFPGHVFKNAFFGLFVIKYLWKYLSDCGIIYIIRIVFLRPIFVEKMVITSYALYVELTLAVELTAICIFV